jgi:hypothetical protein
MVWRWRFVAQSGGMGPWGVADVGSYEEVDLSGEG